MYHHAKEYFELHERVIASFSMPAHLARHQSRVAWDRRRIVASADGSGSGSSKGQRAEGGVCGGVHRRRRASRIVGEMSAYLGELTAQREAIEQRISGLQNMMSMFGGGPAMLAGPARTSRRGRKGRRRAEPR